MKRSVLTGYRKQGGPAGVDLKLVVYATGDVELIDRTRRDRRVSRCRIGSERLARLNEALDNADFRLLPSGLLRLFFRPMTGTDPMSFKVTKGMRSISTGDPADLGPLSDILEELVHEAHSTSGAGDQP